MKALILKDVYVLWKQMRLYVLILSVLALVGGAFNSLFVVVWCSMLPYTAVAYDERSRWGQLAAMMPYTRRDIVLSKYVLGWICMAAAMALNAVIQQAAPLLGRESADMTLLLVSLFAGMIVLDVTMPMVFHFGVERGRMVFMLLIFGVAIAGGVLAEAVEIPEFSLPLLVVMPFAAALATAVSVPLSMKLYRTE